MSFFAAARSFYTCVVRPWGASLHVCNFVSERYFHCDRTVTPAVCWLLQEAQVAAEEARLDKERKALLNELRQRMAVETEMALQQQEKQMGELIGRLQVGDVLWRYVKTIVTYMYFVLLFLSFVYITRQTCQCRFGAHYMYMY